MSARVAILMVKNSRSFELTKIRHYRDKSYRTLYAVAKRDPPRLPVLGAWADETLGGALACKPNAGNVDLAEMDQAEATEIAAPPERKQAGRLRKANSEKKAAPTRRKRSTENADVALSVEPLAVLRASKPKPKSVRSIALGASPPAPRGESCNIRDVIGASEAAQREELALMAAAAQRPSVDATLVAPAMVVLADLSQAFGEDERN